MSAKTRILARLRFAFALAAAFIIAACLVSQAQQPEPPKKPADTKTVPSGVPVIKLPDGSYIFTGSPANGSEGVTITLKELQRIQDQLDQLQKQVAAAQKVSEPSVCSIRGRVEKRGEQLVAVLKLTYWFRTTLPQTMMPLGGRKGFLVSANLDGAKLPILKNIDDGFAALIENAGDHTLSIDLDAPITARGANSKTELGFEIGLPRAPITTFILEPPAPDVKRVTIVTRMTDPPIGTKPPDRRLLDIKSLSSQPGWEKGYPLGQVESLEVTWEPPAAVAQVADQVQYANLDISTLFTEGSVESTAKIKLHGPAREWKVLAPQNADFSVDRTVATAEVGPGLVPTITKPVDPNKPVWKIELPASSPASDWTVTAVIRQIRARADDPKHRGPFPIGPFAVLDVLRQSGTVRVTAGPHTHFTFKHSPDLRQAPLPGPAEDDVAVAFFRLATGPTGTTVPNLPPPLFTVEASPQVGSIAVKPTYKFAMERDPQSDEVVWRIQADIKVSPFHTTIDALAIEIPVEWDGIQSESVSGVALGSKLEGFWSTQAAKLAKGTRVPTLLYLPTSQKQAFDIVLKATMKVKVLPQGTNKVAIPLLRFPSAVERGVTVTASVPEGQEIRESEGRSGDGESSPSRGIPLNPIPAQNGKPSKASTTVSRECDTPLSQVILGWSAVRPDMTADIIADVTLSDRQTEISEQIKLKTVDGFPRIVHFRPTHDVTAVAGLRVVRPTPQSLAQLPIIRTGPSEWTLSIPAEVREVLVEVNYAVPYDRRQAEHTPWNVPIALLWAVGATQTDTTVRIWSNTTVPRKITNLSPEWRELPVEVIPNREAIPSLSLAASSGESPQSPIVEARETNEPSQVSIWVDRSLIQASGTDDGATHFRARFLLRKWLSPSLEVTLPGSIAGSTPEFLVDGSRVVESAQIDDEPGAERTYRMRLPDTSSGKSLTVEILYQLPTTRDEMGEVVYAPPLLSHSYFASPTHWQITVPQGTIPLLTSGATAEFHWRWHLGGFTPEANEISSEESGSIRSETVAARQLAPAQITIYRLPRGVFVAVCSIGLFLVIFFLLRLHVGAVGPVVAVLSSLAGISAILVPHATAQIAGACQPGLAAAIALLLIQAAIRSYHRHRAIYLPGFARVPTEPSGVAMPLPSSTRNRPSGVGSAGAAPVAPAGG